MWFRGLLALLMISCAGGVWAQAGRPPAVPTADSILALIGREIVAVRRYSPVGALDTRRGYEMDTRPLRNVYGDCRSQRITVFRQHLPRADFDAGPDALGELVVTYRFREPDWASGALHAQGDCGDPTVGRWTTATDDETFSRASSVFARLAAETSAGRTPNPSFAITCTEYTQSCVDPGAKLKEAFRLGVGEIRTAGSDLIASQGSYLGGLWIMHISFRQGRTTIRLEFRVPPIIG